MDIWARLHSCLYKTKRAFGCSMLTYSLDVCSATEELTVSVKTYLLKRKAI